ncbi:ComE operon protein 3 [Polaribacter huanghezhanensis]|uniref:ComEC/Rec2 family competence protein n=1 Tax=Polaribacter huanghezhanensis TaxID=1354726 RepID=UPI00264A023C|nr:ComEC/Rec2 family competence protein [Polaribacter huanghezhanensis]WKD85995.1 ComE operon protein 3 [Polaribacter huanghezhanensis]
MKRLLNFLPTHFTICLIVGIVLQFHYKLWQYTFTKAILVFVLFLILIFVLKYFKKKLLFTITSWILFVFVGVFAVFLQNHSQKDNYYRNYFSADSLITFKVEKVLKSNLYYDKYIGSIVRVGNQKTVGTILLNVQRDSLQRTANIGDVFLFKSELSEVQKPLNPYQFDYKKYLEKLGVYNQVFLINTAFIVKESNENSIYKIAENIRAKIEKELIENGFKGEELAVIEALILGQRNDISKDVLEEYTNAGAIHILAVSGLHVGIILLILTFLLKPLEQLKNGKTIKTFLIVLLLWFFAVIAGLSASVVRAVTMFTGIAIGMTFHRKTLIQHTLITSMFVLLLCKPMFLFDVGFQLSYLAVFSIVTIQPKLYQLWKPTRFLTDKFWQLFTVSIAAQLGVLPVSLFYFHQFPGLFMLSNLVIIPFIGIILMLGILVIVLALFQILPTFLADLYMFIISLMNQFVSWISIQESFLIEDISFSFLLLLMSYGCLIFGFMYVERKTYKSTVLFLSFVILFQGSVFYEKKQVEITNEFVIFNKSRKTIIGENKNGNLKIHHDLDSVSVKMLGLIKDYKVGKKVTTIEFKNQFANSYQFKKEIFILVDSLGVYQIGKKLNPIVLLIQSPKINLERLIENIQPKQIIADASNYKNQVVNWKFICDTKNIPFYYTGEKGAIIFE